MTRISGQDGGVGKHGLPPHTIVAKITTKIQNNYHPESPENQAVWKSDNQGIKEVTFIRMGRRGGDVDAETWRYGMDGPTPMCTGQKSGGTPLEQGIPTHT